VTVVEIAPFANVADFVAWHDASTGTFVARRGDLTVTAMWLDNELRVIGFGGTGVTTDDYGKLNLDKWEVQRLRDNWLLTHQHLKNAAKKWPRELKELLPERSEREINELAKGNKVGPLQRKKP
jgi:hypothetical protein